MGSTVFFWYFQKTILNKLDIQNISGQLYDFQYLSRNEPKLVMRLNILHLGNIPYYYCILVSHQVSSDKVDGRCSPLGCKG